MHIETSKSIFYFGWLIRYIMEHSIIMRLPNSVSLGFFETFVLLVNIALFQTELPFLAKVPCDMDGSMSQIHKSSLASELVEV